MSVRPTNPGIKTGVGPHPRDARNEKASQLMSDENFKSACAAAGVKVTLRQAKKWLRGAGAARKAHK